MMEAALPRCTSIFSLHISALMCQHFDDKNIVNRKKLFSLAESVKSLNHSGRSTLQSWSGHRSILEHSGRRSTLAGADTLEEEAEKKHLFAALEDGRNTSVDYSELNRALGDTGLSTLSLRYLITVPSVN